MDLEISEWYIENINRAISNGYSVRTFPKTQTNIFLSLLKALTPYSAYY